MFSRCRDGRIAHAWCALAALLAFGNADARELRACADPDNMPFSDEARRGFENRIIELIASDIGATVVYYWLPQWRGFTRKTLLEGHCDVIPGVPAETSNVLTTAPYYRGTYALIYRADRVPGFTGLHDPRLSKVRIGVAVPGIDATPSPPGRALARRGIFDNVVGFPVISDVPVPKRMIDALVRGDLDVAALWWPQSGYFVARAPVPLSPVPLEPDDGDPAFAFAIAMAVRPGDAELQRTLDASLVRLQSAIAAVLDEYAVTAPLQRAAAAPR
ncbi:MAG TPA: quinoprotein dehydrogenase-associated putative ABC transporter substrate-binding protein [Casimicrobiaceae bacterium]|nr:quinoprotein dehydrogenase-associated putative ABC transporter substrate-binding protein [Casimicrobiaceae bacterium]